MVHEPFSRVIVYVPHSSYKFAINFALSSRLYTSINSEVLEKKKNQEREFHVFQ